MKKDRTTSTLQDGEEFIRQTDEITEEILTGIKNPTEDSSKLLGLLTESDYSAEFIDTLTSPEKFNAKADRINSAFEHRRHAQLMSELKRSSTRQLYRRVASISAAVVVAAVTITALFYTRTIDHQSSRIEKSVMSATVPTLIVDEDRVIQLGSESDRDVLTAVSQECSESDSVVGHMQRLVVPKGYSYEIALSDGTHVQLNAGSELIFPSKFTGDTRRVTLIGEGYFTVAKSTQAFVVEAASAYVKVYGTQFNLNARNPHRIQAVLVEGAIGMGSSTAAAETRLKPSQMAVYTESDGKCRVTDVDPANYIAWCNGNFCFVNASLEEVADEIEAWYGIQLDYSATDFQQALITVSVSRSLSVDSFIRILENSLNAKFVKNKGGDAYEITKL